MKVFLALPSKISQPRFDGPGPAECKQLIELLEEMSIDVTCPMADVDFQDRIPEVPEKTIINRLRAIEEADWIIALPCLRDHKSAGVMGYIYWAIAKGKDVVVLQRGSGNLHLPWQIVGLRDSGGFNLQVVFYEGSIASGFEGLMRCLTSDAARERRESLGTVEEECKYGVQYQWYWNNKKHLFSKWRDGMECDAEGLCSLKPEAIANDIARAIQGEHVLDAFCGVGGVAIALALAGKRVVAVETHCGRFQQAIRNAEIYDVASRIKFMNCDVFEVFEQIDHDSIYVDPSWGGPRYRQRRKFGFLDFDVDGGHDIRELLRIEFNKGKRLAISLPLNFDSGKLIHLHHQLTRRESVERPIDLRIQWHTLQRRLLLMTAFF